MARRPSRSPKCPSTAAPSGRATNPTAYVAKASIVPISGSSDGKNSLLNTSAAAVPYRKKSYHSTAVPVRLDPATIGKLVCVRRLVDLVLAVAMSTPRRFVAT